MSQCVRSRLLNKEEGERHQPGDFRVLDSLPLQRRYNVHLEAVEFLNVVLFLNEVVFTRSANGN